MARYPVGGVWSEEELAAGAREPEIELELALDDDDLTDEEGARETGLGTAGQLGDAALLR